MDIRWIGVRGGMSEFGDRRKPVPIRDLLWSAVPITRDQMDVGSYDGNHPLTNITWAEAADVATRFGARLPWSSEWEWMAAGSERRLYPWGNAEWEVTKANLLPLSVGHVTPVGRFPDGATPQGLLDVAGNIWEWTQSLTQGAGAVVRGGSFTSRPLYARTTFLNAAPVELRSPGIGLRLVRET